MTKVSELTGRKLDEWVARAEGHHVAKYLSENGSDILAVTSKHDRRTRIIEGGTTMEWFRSGIYHPSTDAKEGQPIMERERIGVQWLDVAEDKAMGWRVDAGWIATPPRFNVSPGEHSHAHTIGPDGQHSQGAAPPPRAATALLAGMRVRVAMVYGDEVPA